jgi:transcriptional regulator with XRE-family HTH domain
MKNNLSQKELGVHCDVTRESIRRAEQGLQTPSNKLLARWLKSCGLQLEDRPDIIRSIIVERQVKSTPVAEVAALQDILKTGLNSAKENLLNDLTNYIKELASLTDETLPSQKARLKRILEQHLGND